MAEAYHNPVLLRESVDLLAIQGDGVYVDTTYGGGGHSARILQEMTEGRLYAFDKDAEAHANLLGDPRLELIRSDFRHLKRELQDRGIDRVDGILADLGISSRHVDAPERGFSFRADAPLDMRMDQRQELGAAELLASYEEAELARVLRRYGEIPNARRLAAAIVRERVRQPLETTGQLAALAEAHAGRTKRHKYLGMVFQALRIEVNGELDALAQLLQDGAEMLAPGGRFVVISYHSLEDRMVKHFFRTGNLDDEDRRDFFGRPIRSLEPIARKAVAPTDEEILSNPRARSARLRAAQKQ